MAEAGAGVAANHFQLSVEDPVDEHGVVPAAGHECVVHHSPLSRDAASEGLSLH